MTDQLDLLPATKQPTRRMPVEPIVRAADIDGEYRWSATRAWGAGPRILWVLLNPSVADGKRDDPTMLRMIGFSYRWGFGSMVVVNLYPRITSNPFNLKAWIRVVDADNDITQVWPYQRTPLAALHHNLQIVRGQIAEATTYVAAWGNSVDHHRVEDVLDGMTLSVDTSEHDGFGIVRVPVDWYCLGKNDDGSPRHPLARGRNRVPDDAKLKVWRKAA